MILGQICAYFIRMDFVDPHIQRGEFLYRDILAIPG